MGSVVHLVTRVAISTGGKRSIIGVLTSGSHGERARAVLPVERVDREQTRFERVHQILGAVAKPRVVRRKPLPEPSDVIHTPPGAMVDKRWECSSANVTACAAAGSCAHISIGRCWMG